MVITSSMFRQCPHDYKYIGEKYTDGTAYEQYKCRLCDDVDDVEVPN